MPRVVIIVSAGRTGTQFLARYFAANYEGVVALHEPAPTLRLRLLSNARASGKLAPEDLLPQLKRLRAGHPERHGDAKLYIESNGFLYGFVDLLPELWPEVTVIHVIRDPRDAVRSALNHGNYRGIKRLAGRLIPNWLPDPRVLADVPPPTSPIGRYAAAWAIINRTIATGGREISRYHVIRFEDLMDATGSGLRWMCEAIGLDYRESGAVSAATRFNASKSHYVAAWPTWEPERCRELQSFCGPLMREHGYGDEPHWLEKVAT